MSQDDFYGRPINEGFNSIEFNLCEVCQRKSPVWMEAKNDGDTTVVRFTCDDCHQEDLEENISPDFYAREASENEEIEQSTRPAWMEDMIEEQKKKGAIETIGTSEEVKASAKATSFSSAPESFQSEEPESDIPDYDEKERQVALWAPEFIQEALFGADPQGWLEKQGAMEESNIDITIKTLGSFVDHDLPSVKLSAVQSLGTIGKKFPQKTDTISEKLLIYSQDQDDNISDFAKQTLDNIK